MRIRTIATVFTRRAARLAKEGGSTMRTRRTLVTIVLLAVVTVPLLSGSVAGGPPTQDAENARPINLAGTVASKISYQGRLTDAAGNPLTGNYNLLFQLWNDATGGSQVGGDIVRNSVPVSSGLFTVGLDVPQGAFSGQALWLRIQVNGQWLSPRQELLPVPYALALPGLWTQSNAISPNLIGGYSGNSVTAGANGAAIGGGGASGNTNRVTDDYGAVGGGRNNQAGDNAGTTSDRLYATVAGGWSNTASGGAATVAGGYSNAAGGSSATVGGGISNVVSGDAATVSGGGGNTASGLASTVGGGSHNMANADYSTIGGGGPSDPDQPLATNNRITDGYGTIAGGGYNRVGSDDGNPTNAQYATVGGGYGNVANRDSASVGGGFTNEAGGDNATIAGGVGNEASGYAASVGGGLNNRVIADFGTISGGGRSEVTDPNTANRVTDDYGTISGGGSNQAGDDDGNTTSAVYATVGGGKQNTASGTQSTIAGGAANTAAYRATVGGGLSNSAAGQYSTVPGGYLNVAGGSYSFAAGQRAKANHQGAFVWADSTSADFASSTSNEFAVRASGGVRFAGNDFRIYNSAGQLGFAVDEKGTSSTRILEITGGSDLAEPFEIAGAVNVEPGMLVAIDPQHPGQLRVADKAYDRTVAGCVSGANGIQPGLTMQQAGSVTDGAFPVALSGRVYCWADATMGPILPGDLLTTSDTPGHAMKATDRERSFGSVIGKAMSSLETGRGLVLVLVTLQ